MEIDVPKIDQFWENQMVNTHNHNLGGSNGHLQYERNLNFATVTVEDSEYGYPKKKTARDPLSHRIIEKRRRDRMNNCLADLARLLPAASLRKGRGRIEKTEIVELAIKHLKHLQMHACPQSDTCEFNQMARNQKSQLKASSSSSDSSGSSQSNSEDNFRLGYQECLSETMHFLVETEGMYAGDAVCLRLVKHLNNHCDNITRVDHTGKNIKHSLGYPLNPRKMREADNNFKIMNKGGSPSSSGYQANGSSSGSDANGGNDGEGSPENEPFTLPPTNSIQHCNGTERVTSNFDYEGDNNSCSSNPLSIEVSDTLDSDGKNANSSSTKPPIPTIIYSGNSSNSRSPAVLSSSNGRSSDDGGSSNSGHRYKFKNNINKRFNADLQTKHDIEDNISAQENDVYAEENDQNVEERSKLEIDNTNMTMSSNSSNGDSEPPNSNDIPEVISTANERERLSKSPGKFTPSLIVPLIVSPDTKPLLENFEKKLALEDSLMMSGSPSDASNMIVEKKTCTIPLAAFIKGEDAPAIPLPRAPVGGTTGVPAFALHDKGLYYIPLTIDKSIVSPFIAAMEPNTQPPLHPVTISVCFLLSAQESQKKLKDSSFVSDNISLPVPVPLPIPLSLPVAMAANIAPVNSLLKTPKGLPRDQAFIMNRFTQSQPQQFNTKENSGGKYRYPVGLNGSGGSSSSGSFSPVSSLVTYPVLYGTNSPGSSINFGNSSHNSQGSLSSYQSSSHHNYYHNHSSSSGSSSNNSDRDSLVKAVRTAVLGHDGNKLGSNINAINPNGNNSSGNSSTDNGSNSSNGHGHTSSRSNRNSGLCPSRSQNRKRSISSSPSASGSGSNLSSSIGYHSWYEKSSNSSKDSIYPLGISTAVPEEHNGNYPDNLTHHYGHNGSANHLHPISHGHTHGYSHIHPMFSHGHSHTHHANHYEEKEQGERTKGRLSPNKRSKKPRISLDQDLQHKHNLTLQGGPILR